MTGRYSAYKRLNIFIIYLGFMLLIAGCGKEKMPEVTPQPQVQTTEWKSKGFAISGDILEKQGLWAAEYSCTWMSESDFTPDAEANKSHEGN